MIKTKMKTYLKIQTKKKLWGIWVLPLMRVYRSYSRTHSSHGLSWAVILRARMRKEKFQKLTLVCQSSSRVRCETPSRIVHTNFQEILTLRILKPNRTSWTIWWIPDLPMLQLKLAFLSCPRWSLMTTTDASSWAPKHPQIKTSKVAVVATKSQSNRHGKTVNKMKKSARKWSH